MTNPFRRFYWRGKRRIKIWARYGGSDWLAVVCGILFLSWRKKQVKNLKYIFLLAHPRSGSTLLSHILVTNPEVIGYGENHKAYNRKSDLFWLLSRTALRLKDFTLSATYVLDKIVLRDYSIAYPIKNSTDTKFILMVREPKPTLVSMSKVVDEWKDEKRCCDHYNDCLKWLTSEAVDIHDKKRVLLIRYEDLLNSTDAVLKSLQIFLGTRNPFTREYHILPTTGKLRFGDNSSAIKRGKIVTPSSKESESIISDTNFAVCIKNFNHFKTTIKNYCTFAIEPKIDSRGGPQDSKSLK